MHKAFISCLSATQGLYERQFLRRWFALDPFKVNNQCLGHLFEILFDLRRLGTSSILLNKYGKYLVDKLMIIYVNWTCNAFKLD